MPHLPRGAREPVRAIADESGRSAVSSHVTGVEDGASSEFGANEWLVDEMYEKYIVDKSSVDKTGWRILESHKPTVEQGANDPTPTDAAPTDPTPTATITLPVATVH